MGVGMLKAFGEGDAYKDIALQAATQAPGKTIKTGTATRAFSTEWPSLAGRLASSNFRISTPHIFSWASNCQKPPALSARLLTVAVHVYCLLSDT